MRKVTYWYARCLDDSDVYSIRARTRREAVAQRSEQPDNFGRIVKVTVEFVDAFDLLQRALGEGRLYEEAAANSVEEAS